MLRKYKLLVITALLLVSNSCVKNPVTGKRDFMLLSKQQEIAMGQASDPDIVNLFGLYQDEKLQNFIDQKGKQMVAVSHRSDLKYDFKIVDSPVVNAFAVPGGYVYFTRGIMAHFNNEAEFAGVLGHEIGHIAARHSAKQYSKSMLAQVGLVAGMVLSPEFAQFGEIAQAGVGVLFLKFGRDAERESDRLGVEYSTKIGYDALQMAGFFNTLDRMSKQSGAGEAPGFLSTHPSPASRNKRVAELTREWKAKVNDKTFEVNRNSYLQMINGMVYGEDPRQGFVENNSFYHPELRFQFNVPSGWLTQNTPQKVQMAPKDGNALMMLTLAQANSLQNAAEQIIQQNQLTLIESKSETVNGLPAIAMIADQPQEQQTIRALIYLIQYGDNIYNMMGVSLAKDFTTLFPQFTNSIKSFQQLTDQSKINKQPDRIRIKTVKQNGTLEQALRSHGAQQDKLEELSIINGMRLNDQVAQGTLIKLIDK